MCRTSEHAINIIDINVRGTLFVFQLLLHNWLDQPNKLELLTRINCCPCSCSLRCLCLYFLCSWLCSWCFYSFYPICWWCCWIYRKDWIYWIIGLAYWLSLVRWLYGGGFVPMYGFFLWLWLALCVCNYRWPNGARLDIPIVTGFIWAGSGQ